MPFPEVERVIYEESSLYQVVCQLRFPSILKIDSELPASFQEKIRKDYPDFIENARANIGDLQEMEEKIQPELLRQVLQASLTKNYQFSSEDNSWKINLTRSFLALTTTNYKRWEGFKKRLMTLLEAFKEIYSPSHLSRIGLRYVNVFDRSILGLGDIEWTELFKPYVLGFAAETKEDDLEAHESKHEVRLADKESIARIKTKLVIRTETGEKCLMIDGDFHTTKKIDILKTEPKLDFFHLRASRLIHWCIEEKLHKAMKPKPI